MGMHLGKSAHIAGTLAFASILCLITGCEEPPPKIKTWPVQGKVTVDEQPLRMGTILFTPDAAKGNLSKLEARGILTADGQYSLRTGELVGAPPGWYRVTIYAMDSVDSTKLPEWLADEKYTKAETSGLAAEVVEKPAAGAYDFQVTK
jgi:hypothetical protein